MSMKKKGKKKQRRFKKEQQELAKYFVDGRLVKVFSQPKDTTRMSFRSIFSKIKYPEKEDQNRVYMVESMERSILQPVPSELIRPARNYWLVHQGTARSLEGFNESNLLNMVKGVQFQWMQMLPAAMMKDPEVFDGLVLVTVQWRSSFPDHAGLVIGPSSHPRFKEFVAKYRIPLHQIHEFKLPRIVTVSV